MQKSFHFTTQCREGAIDITSDMVNTVKESDIQTGILNIYVQGTTAAVSVQENWDSDGQDRNISLLERLTALEDEPFSTDQEQSAGRNNRKALQKATLLGASETLPIINGKIGLSPWRNIFLYEFDGPRKNRTVIVTICSCS